MTILHLDSGREMRGGQWQALYLVEGLLAKGVECILLARDGGGFLAEAKRRGIHAQPIGARRMIAQSRRADLIHAHDAASHTMAAVFDRQRLVVSRRVAFAVGSSAASRWKYTQAMHFVAVSQHVKRCLLESGVPEEKITVIYDGVPLAEPAQSGPVLAMDWEDPEKGKALTVEAARLAGCEIEFTKDLAASLKSARCLVYLTRQEGLGSGILLAMAAGVPVIASAVGGIPEVIEHGVNGLLAPNEAHAVAAALRRLESDPALAAELGRKARETVIRRFGCVRMVEEHLRLYTRLIRQDEE